MKYLDMPEGNGTPSTYTKMMAHASKGRMVAIVPIKLRGTYILSYNPGFEPTLDQVPRMVTRAVLRAREAAEAEDHEPITLP